jgi:predicted RNase H-like HicB family nuclease
VQTSNEPGRVTVAGSQEWTYTPETLASSLRQAELKNDTGGTDESIEGRGGTSSYLIVSESGEATNYSAYCPDLPGVVATGATVDECADEMREAIRFHLEGLREAREPVPLPTGRGVIN